MHELSNDDDDDSGEILMQSLERVAGDHKKLRIFHSDHLDYHSIMDALKGCSGLFYCFEPPSDQPTYDVCMPHLQYLCNIS